MKNQILPALIYLSLLTACGSSDPVSHPDDSLNRVNTESTMIKLREELHPDADDEKQIAAWDSFINQWSNADELDGQWISLERTESGYVRYRPINGNTPNIRIINHNMQINWWIEGPIQFRIEDVKMNKNGQSINFIGLNTDGVRSEFEVRIADPAKKLVLWKFTINWPESLGGKMTYKWAMTRDEFVHEFPFIDYKSKPNTVAEKVFLPIIID